MKANWRTVCLSDVITPVARAEVPVPGRVYRLYGKVASSEFGLAVTLGTFTARAKSFGKSKSNLRLIDGDELVDLVLQHYEQFDSRYKGLLPLKRVYVPQILDESED